METFFNFVINTYAPMIDCVQTVNQQIGEDLAVCSITIENIDMALLQQIGEDKSGKLDNPLFEIDSYKFFVWGGTILQISQDETVTEAMKRIDALDYVVDIHAHYNERKGVWGHLKVYIYLPLISTNDISYRI